jgi:hypothetical protein
MHSCSAGSSVQASEHKWPRALRGGGVFHDLQQPTPTGRPRGKPLHCCAAGHCVRVPGRGFGRGQRGQKYGISELFWTATLRGWGCAYTQDWCVTGLAFCVSFALSRFDHRSSVDRQHQHFDHCTTCVRRVVQRVVRRVVRRVVCCDLRV